MKTKHTPGNWQMILNNQKNSKYWWTIESEKGQVICNTPGNDSEQESNAKLISCAPELLEALQCAYLNCKNLTNEADEFIKSVILKATK